MKQDAVIDTKKLIRYADGDLTPPEAEEIAQKIENNAEAKARLSELQEIMGHLRHVDDAVDEIDFVPMVRAAVAASTTRRPMWLVQAFAAGLAVCVAAGLALYFSWSPSGEAEMTGEGQFRVKGGDAAHKEREKWTRLSAYVTDGVAKPQELGDQIQTKDALLFSYSNNGREPFKHLMVFAVDSFCT